MIESQKSKIEQVLALVDSGQYTAHGASKKIGLAPSHAYRALAKRRAERSGKCPTCGHKVKPH